MGSIDKKVLLQFINLNGGICKFVVLVTVSLLGVVALKVLASIWIQLWCQNPSEDQYELWVFFGMHVASIICLFIGAYTIIFSGARQSTTVHQ